MECEYESLQAWNTQILRYFELKKAPHIISIEQTYRRMTSGEKATKETLTLLHRLQDAYVIFSLV